MTDLELLREMIAEPATDVYTDPTLTYYMGKYIPLEACAAFIWGLKAAKVQAQLKSMPFTKTQVGSETYEYRSLTDEFQTACTMRDYYSGLAVTGSNSQSPKVYGLAKPDIFGQG